MRKKILVVSTSGAGIALIAAVVASIVYLSGEISARDRDLEARSAELQKSTADFQEAASARDESQSRAQQLDTDLQMAQADLTQSENRIDELKGALAESSERAAALEDSLGDAEKANEALAADLAVAIANGKAAVIAERAKLNSAFAAREIDLREEYEETFVYPNIVACTGSMNPAITCLDGLWSKPVVDPCDVEIDDIISFSLAARP